MSSRVPAGRMIPCISVNITLCSVQSVNGADNCVILNYVVAMQLNFDDCKTCKLLFFCI